MMKVYSSDICGECKFFKELAAERGIEVEYFDITASVPNLREFLQLRDHHEAFVPVRERGSIGIPAFVREDGEITLDMNTALAWLGQPPVVMEMPGCANCK